MYISPCWSANTGTSMCRLSLKNVTYKFVLTSVAVSRISCSSWMVFEMGGKWQYSCYFAVCCFQDLFNITRSILVQFHSSFSSLCFVSIYVVQPLSITDTTAAWNKSCFILSDGSGHMINTHTHTHTHTHICSHGHHL